MPRMPRIPRKPRFKEGKTASAEHCVCLTDTPLLAFPIDPVLFCLPPHIVITLYRHMTATKHQTQSAVVIGEPLGYYPALSRVHALAGRKSLWRPSIVWQCCFRIEQTRRTLAVRVRPANDTRKRASKPWHTIRLSFCALMQSTADRLSYINRMSSGRRIRIVGPRHFVAEHTTNKTASVRWRRAQRLATCGDGGDNSGQ